MGAATIRGDSRRMKGEAMAKKKKKKLAAHAARKAKKKLKVAKKRIAKKTTSVRKATRAAGKKQTVPAKTLPAAKPAGLPQQPQAPARTVKPQSARQDSLREALPDDLELDDDLADEVPNAMRDEMDDEESLDEEGRRGDYLDKPDELSGEDEE